MRGDVRIAGSLREKAARVRFILLDVDGTLTDGQLMYGPGGESYKSFNVKDGLGINLAQKEGIQIGLVSGRRSTVVEERAAELGIHHIWQDIENKCSFFRELLKHLDVSPAEVAYMGDDLNDLPLLKEVGFSAAPGDAVQEVQKLVDYVAKREGGRGAVREFLDFVRAARGKAV